jgi:hypothetical protein
MKELEKVKQHALHILDGTSYDFIMITHEHIEDDVWEIMCRSELTGKYYTFKDDSSRFFDFAEKE